jgi:putative membrane protein
VDYEDIKHLRGLMGGEFDMAYVKDVVNDHINLVNEYTAASENMPDPKMRRFAADTLPVVREHSRLAQKLEDQLAGQTAGPDNTKPATSPVATANDADR